MSIADIPKIPPEYEPRMQKLSEKIKAKEITLEEVMTNALSVLGRVTIDSGGIRITGDYGSFEADDRIFRVTRDFLFYLFEFLPRFFGKRLLIKKGDDFKKVTIGIGIRKSRASEKDIRNRKLPILEFVNDPITKQDRIYVHRLEELVAWVGDDWKEGSILFKLAIPLSDVLIKEFLDKQGEPVAPYCDRMLKRCGV